MTADPTPATENPMPEWFGQASTRFVETAVASELADSEAEGRRWVQDAVERFAETVHENGGDDYHWLILAYSLARLAIKHAPDGTYATDGSNYVQIEDTHTGMAVPDPEAEIGDDFWAAAVLAAGRFLVAEANNDPDTASAIFRAAGDNKTGVGMVMVLAQMASGAFVGWLDRTGKLPDQARAALALREAERAANVPEPPTVRTSSTGTEYRSLPVEDADRTLTPEAKAAVAPHGGSAIYTITSYPLGVPGALEQAVELAHREGEAMFGPDDADAAAAVRCGVHHHELIETWQVPHSARTQINRHLRHQKRMTGREFQLVRCWQHTYRCPESLSPEDQARLAAASGDALFDASTAGSPNTATDDDHEGGE